MTEAILGISAYYHDSAAALISNGNIIAAAQQERFSRKKHDASFPGDAVEYVLEEGAVGLGDISAIVFYDKPFLKFERLLETYHAFAPRGISSFLTAIPVWVKEKLFMRGMLEKSLAALLPAMSRLPPIYFSEHHLSHQASAFFPSPFEEAAILTIDGVGEWTTTSIAAGKGNKIENLLELRFPHSLGLLYSAFTAYCGFRVNSGEYNLMGLAPYGHAKSDQTMDFERKIREHLVDIRDDGSFLLNMEYFDFATGLRMYNERSWRNLFGIGPRATDEENIGQEHMNLALAIQRVTEDIYLRLARTAARITGSENLCLAGGVALNCVANGRLLESDLFSHIWAQPAAGDAGGALGAALAYWHIAQDKPRKTENTDSMGGTYLGPAFGHDDMLRVCKKFHAAYEFFDSEQTLADNVADLLAAGMVVGWFQGRMEYGPRALGNRSILGDPRNPEMQKRLNLKIKYREGFRPFAPAVLEEQKDAFFQMHGADSPYMLMVCPVRDELRHDVPAGYDEMDIWERLYQKRSILPAITHVDWSARIQTISRKNNPRFWALANAFFQRHGCPVLVNTSFNVRGEPVVCTPEDAYLCFMRTEMDYLVMGNIMLAKTAQPSLPEWACGQLTILPD